MKNIWSRRDFLFQSGGGIAGLALAQMLHEQKLLASAAPADACAGAPIGVNPLAPKPPHFTPRAKAVISLFMTGGISQLDTFDYKPALEKYSGQVLTGDVRVHDGRPGPVLPSIFKFKQYGQSGKYVSEIFPNLGTKVDEIAFMHSVWGRSDDHVQSTLEMQTGQLRMGFPSMGAWITYGLGSENASLPGFVVLQDQRGGALGSTNNWQAGFLPSTFQGTPFGPADNPIIDLKRPAGVTAEQQRLRLDMLARLNQMHADQYPGSSELAARISSYELAYRMQGCAPDAVDIKSESAATKKLYGLDEKITEPFGKQCLMARRLIERGVRFVQVFSGGLGVQNTDTWDAHKDMKENHSQHAKETDLPITGLLTDLKALGLLDSTLVVFHSEFGRMPLSENGVGRDHNPGAMTVWMAGARIKGGQSIGSSDELGYKAEHQPISYHDFHATILALLGIEHTKLTYRYNGRDMRLTDVAGELIPQIVA
jgi:uncharacterized protein (DUF1501 family)